MKCFKYIAMLMIGLVFSSSHAGYLGTIGQTYPIGEESLLNMIMNKLQAKEKSGELKKLQNDVINRSMQSIKQMAPVDGISTVSVRAQRIIDPTVYYAKAVTTDDGKIVVPSGARINPLTITSFTKRLVFFDGRDPEQVTAVSRLVQSGGLKIKPILIAGSWLDLTKNWKQQVYFDQHGVLSKRFGIHAVPAVISQQGNMLLHQEIPAKELS